MSNDLSYHCTIRHFSPSTALLTCDVQKDELSFTFKLGHLIYFINNIRNLSSDKMLNALSVESPFGYKYLLNEGFSNWGLGTPEGSNEYPENFRE